MGNTNIAVIGDPGIGKSTLARYLFIKMHEQSNAKIFLSLESGQWIYSEAGTFKSGTTESDIWRKKDVILIVDGQFLQKFLAKLQNVILFCSPEKSNYQKMIKLSNGMILVMPPWDWEDCENLYKKKIVSTGPSLGYKIMLPYYERMRQHLNNDTEALEEVEVAEEVATEALEEVDTVAADLDSDVNMEVDGSDSENGAMPMDSKDTSKIDAFLLNEIQERYKLIGGRIRQILNPSISRKILKNDLKKSINAVEINLISQVGSFEKHSYIPSVLYSLKPQDYNALLPYEVSFASDFIAEAVLNKVLIEKAAGLKDFFAALKQENTMNSLLGCMFEKIVHRLFCEQEEMKFEMKKLSDGSFKDFIFLSPKDILKYAHKSSDLHVLCVETPCYLMPNDLNAPQVDAVYFSGLKGDRITFFQITVGKTHPIKVAHVQKLAKSFGKEFKDIDFVFVVPESSYNNFPMQNFVNKNLSISKKNHKLDQYVLGVKNEMFNKLTEFTF